MAPTERQGDRALSGRAVCILQRDSCGLGAPIFGEPVGRDSCDGDRYRVHRHSRHDVPHRLAASDCHGRLRVDGALLRSCVGCGGQPECVCEQQRAGLRGRSADGLPLWSHNTGHPGCTKHRTGGWWDECDCSRERFRAGTRAAVLVRPERCAGSSHQRDCSELCVPSSRWSASGAADAAGGALTAGCRCCCGCIPVCARCTARSDASELGSVGRWDTRAADRHRLRSRAHQLRIRYREGAIACDHEQLDAAADTGSERGREDDCAGRADRPHAGSICGGHRVLVPAGCDDRAARPEHRPRGRSNGSAGERGWLRADRSHPMPLRGGIGGCIGGAHEHKARVHIAAAPAGQLLGDDLSERSGLGAESAEVHLSSQHQHQPGTAVLGAGGRRHHTDSARLEPAACTRHDMRVWWGERFVGAAHEQHFRRVYLSGTYSGSVRSVHDTSQSQQGHGWCDERCKVRVHRGCCGDRGRADERQSVRRGSGDSAWERVQQCEWGHGLCVRQGRRCLCGQLC